MAHGNCHNILAAYCLHYLQLSHKIHFGTRYLYSCTTAAASWTNCDLNISARVNKPEWDLLAWMPNQNLTNEQKSYKRDQLIWLFGYIPRQFTNTSGLNTDNFTETSTISASQDAENVTKHHWYVPVRGIILQCSKKWNPRNNFTGEHTDFNHFFHCYNNCYNA